MKFQIPDVLKRAINNDPTNCVLFVGSGLSASGVREGGEGLPGWDQLVLNMVNDLDNAGRCSQYEIASLRALVGAHEHLQVADKYASLVQRDELIRFLKSQLDPPDLCCSPLHERILRIGFHGIVSFNLDRVFEQSSKNVAPVAYPSLVRSMDWVQSRGFLAKIHGCIGSPGDPSADLILTSKSYDSLRDNEAYQTLLGSLLLLHPAITVGLSLRDPDFIGWIEDLQVVFKDAQPTIYCLMLDPGPEFRDKWREKKVEVIPYAAHSDLAEAFGELEKMVAAGQAKSQANAESCMLSGSSECPWVWLHEPVADGVKAGEGTDQTGKEWRELSWELWSGSRSCEDVQFDLAFAPRPPEEEVGAGIAFTSSGRRLFELSVMSNGAIWYWCDGDVGATRFKMIEAKHPLTVLRLQFQSKVIQVSANGTLAETIDLKDAPRQEWPQAIEARFRIGGLKGSTLDAAFSRPTAG